MKKIHVEGGGFPGTSKTWRFIAEMIQQNADMATAMAGNNSIVSGCEVNNNVAADGIVIINGEMYPFVGGNVQTNPYIEIQETAEATQYLKDDNGDGQGDTIDTYFARVAVLTSSAGDLQNGLNKSFSALTRLKSLKEVSKRIPPMTSIVMYYGSIANIPEGWQLCNGTNGTPDLSGKFIVGYDPNDNDYNQIAKSGGEKRHTLTENEMPSHAHGGNTNTGGSHSHNYRDTIYSEEGDRGTTTGINGTELLGSGGENRQSSTDTNHSEVWSHYKNRQISSSGTHSHNFTTNNKGGGQAHENRPPYFTLAYITYVG